MVSEKIQYWNDRIMMGLVTKEESIDMMKKAREAGHKVYDNGHYFTIINKR